MKISHKNGGLICIGLVILVAMVYLQVANFHFTSRDDDNYVTANKVVQEGLSPVNIGWAFTTNHEANWHPLTWVSLMTDKSIAGVLDACGIYSGVDDSGLFHLVNVLFHSLNSVLLFLLLKAITGSYWRSAAVAILFAVHPAHAESVAWVSERKDVLSTAFLLLAIWAYCNYTKAPSLSRYISVVVLFAMGLMSKPMLVSFPFLLLLLDVWPLGRLNLSEPRLMKNLSRLALEKLPMFLLTIASCVVTFWAQRSGLAVATLESTDIGIRISNAFVAYFDYVRILFWPTGLAYLYPHPMDSVPLTKVITSIAFVITLTTFSVVFARRYPQILVGWLWFLITLVPVIGLVQVGNQALADRYTYVPYIGLFAILVYAPFTDKAILWVKQAVGLVIALAVILGLSLACHKQVGYWRNDYTLYTRAIQVTRNNSFAHHALGLAHVRDGDYQNAERHFKLALKYHPEYTEARINLGSSYAMQSKYNDAEMEFKRVLKADPRANPVRNNLGALYWVQGRNAEAIGEWEKSLEIDPSDQEADAYLSEATGM